MSETPLQTTQRYFKFVRSWTMTDPVHAKVELATNSIDAIKRARAFVLQQNLNIQINNLVEIEEDLLERKMLIRDFSIGMRAEKMRSALLIIGDLTSESGSRGTFSTGAKNVSQLGRVTWRSIRDGFYSSCYITTEGMGAMVDQDVPATEEHRALLSAGSTSFMSQNGTVVILEYGQHVTLNRADEQITRFLNYFSMRDTLSSSDFSIFARYRNPSAAHPNAKYLYDKSAHAPGISDIYSIATFPVANDGSWSDWFSLKYNYPSDSTLVERIAYVVPEYPQATAYFELYKTVRPAIVPRVFEEDTIQFGISVVTGRAVHEQSCLWPEFRTNEDMRHFYGRLRCDYIDELLSSYDVVGPTATNPVSIIDPSRLYGVNRSHKFIQWLFSIPTELIRKQLRILRDDFDRKNGISSADVLNLAGTLQEVGEKLFDTTKVELNWRETADGKMLKAIRDQEKFVFLRDVGVYELHANILTGTKPEQDIPVFVFKNDALVDEIERNRSAAQTAAELDRLKKVRIIGKGDLIPLKDDEDVVPPEFKTLNPQIKIEILYSDAPDLTRRYRTFVDKELIRITINMNSPCFLGQLKKNPQTGVITGFDKVSPILVESLVQAFTHVYVKQKIQSASLRNVQFANNAAAAQEMKYSEEYEDALTFVEREIYGRVARAIAGGALDDGVLTLDEILNA